MAKDETIYISSEFILFLAIKEQAPDKKRKKNLEDIFKHLNFTTVKFFLWNGKWGIE